MACVPCLTGSRDDFRTIPRGSIYTTIRELGPKIPYYRRNYGSQFPNGCICGPSGIFCPRVTEALPSMPCWLQTQPAPCPERSGVAERVGNSQKIGSRFGTPRY